MTNAKIINVQPLAPMKVIIEGEEKDGSKFNAEAIMFMDQFDGKIYDFHGPVDKNMQEAIGSWIDNKTKEMEKKIRSGIAHATPQQLAEMGIDINNLNNKNPRKIITS